jgi:hypothetical protein
MIPECRQGADGLKGHDQGYIAAGLPALIELFASACDVFTRSLSRSDDVADEVDFTGSLHELGFGAGRVSALGQALTVITGNTGWTAQADAVLAEYLAATSLPEEHN